MELTLSLELKVKESSSCVDLFSFHMKRVRKRTERIRRQTSGQRTFSCRGQRGCWEHKDPSAQQKLKLTISFKARDVPVNCVSQQLSSQPLTLVSVFTGFNQQLCPV